MLVYINEIKSNFHSIFIGKGFPSLLDRTASLLSFTTGRPECLAEWLACRTHDLMIAGSRLTAATQ